MRPARGVAATERVPEADLGLVGLPAEVGQLALVLGMEIDQARVHVFDDGAAGGNLDDHGVEILYQGFQVLAVLQVFAVVRVVIPEHVLAMEQVQHFHPALHLQDRIADAGQFTHEFREAFGEDVGFADGEETNGFDGHTAYSIAIT